MSRFGDDEADTSQKANSSQEDERQFNSPQKAEQIRTTIGKVVKDNRAAAKRFKYLVDKTLANNDDDLRRDESA